MKQRMVEALNTGIETMHAGGSVEDCLKIYPDLSGELRGLLKIVESLECLRVESIPEEAIHRSRLMLLTQANKLANLEKKNTRSVDVRNSLHPLKEAIASIHRLNPVVGRLALALSIAGMLIIFSSSLLITSAKSLPGDSLYPVKLAVENIKVHLAPSGEARQKFETSYSQQRVAEVQRLLGLGRVQKISFEGTISSVDNSQWTVSGITVEIQSKSSIVTGSGGIRVPETGMKVEVEGMTSPQGWVVADEIHIREYSTIGMVENITTDYWEISGIIINVTSDTQIDAGIQVGDEVRVLLRSEDGGLFAVAITQYPGSTPDIATPQPTNVNPMATGEPSSEDVEERQINGVVESIAPNFWTVDGEDIRIVGKTQISGDIKLGDVVSIKYRVETDGSITALEIYKSETSDQHQGMDDQESQETDTNHEVQSTPTQTPTQDKETGSATPNPEHVASPEPTDSPLNHD